MKRSYSGAVLQTANTFKNASKLSTKGSNVVLLEPTSKTDKCFEFELSSTQIVAFGLYTGFIIEGVFQKKAAGENATWVACEEADAQTVVVQRNWFEHTLKGTDIFHINSEISPHDVPNQADAALHGYLLDHMHPSTKKFLCPEPCNPGNASSMTKEGWKVNATSKWVEYSKSIFNGPIKFRYIPLFKFPFYQGANFVLDKHPFENVPIPAIGNLHIRMYFMDNPNKIFRKTDANTNSFRFNLTSVNLAIEEMRYNPNIEKQLLSSKKAITFHGVTKLGMAHNIPVGVHSYTAKLNKVYLPQGLFIFCLPKSVIPGTYNYSSFNDMVFQNHNIKNVTAYFGGKPFYSKSPTPYEIGTLTSNNKAFFDHIKNPPFGITQDFDRMEYDYIKDGGLESPYPHIYVDLTQGSADSRLFTENIDTTLIQNKEFLDVALQFNATGAQDQTYYVYYFYTDINVILDMNAKRFINVYNNTKLTV